MASKPISLAFSDKDFGPYSKPIKCQVVAAAEATSYRAKDGEERKSLTAAVSDGESVVKVIAYDASKFKYLKEDQSIVLREIIRKNDGQRCLIITKQSKVFMTAPVQIQAGHKEQGRNIINPPPAEIVSVKEALGSPPKRKVSVCGRIVQEEEARKLVVRGEEVNIKNIYIEDKSDKAKVTLWRECSNMDFRTGDHVEITDVVINIYNNATSLQTTMLSKLKKSEEPEVTKEVYVDAISVDDGVAELLLQDETSLTCNAELLQAALATEDNVLPEVELATAAGTLHLYITCKGKDVKSILKL